MSILQGATWIMLFFGGLFTGGILLVAVERTNLWRRMPLDQYAVDFRRSVFRIDPMMPIFGAITSAGAAVFASNSSGDARSLAWVAFGLLVAIILASVAIAEPMNSKFRRLPEGEVPQDAGHIRDRWRAFHTARTVLALSVLACLAGAVSADP